METKLEELDILLIDNKQKDLKIKDLLVKELNQLKENKILLIENYKEKIIRLNTDISLLEKEIKEKTIEKENFYKQYNLFRDSLTKKYNLPEGSNWGYDTDTGEIFLE